MKTTTLLLILLAFGISSCSESTSPEETKRAGVGSTFTFTSKSYDEANTLTDSATVTDTIIASGVTFVGVQDAMLSVSDGDSNYYKFESGDLVRTYQNEIQISSTVSFQGLWILYNKSTTLDTVFTNTQNVTFSGFAGTLSMTVAKRYVKDSTYTVPATGEKLNTQIMEKIITSVATVNGVGVVNTSTITIRTAFCSSLGYYVSMAMNSVSTSSQSPIPNGSDTLELQSYVKK
jgi:hypothetical protein